jgi:hypothetical protein
MRINSDLLAALQVGYNVINLSHIHTLIDELSKTAQPVLIRKTRIGRSYATSINILFDVFTSLVVLYLFKCIS